MRSHIHKPNSTDRNRIENSENTPPQGLISSRLPLGNVVERSGKLGRVCRTLAGVTLIALCGIRVADHSTPAPVQGINATDAARVYHADIIDDIIEIIKKIIGDDTGGN